MGVGPEFSVVEWLKDHAGLLGLVIGLIGTSFGGWRWLNPLPLDAELLNAHDRERLVAQYSRTGMESYLAFLDWLLGFADRFWGVRPLGGAAFERSMQIAFLYPMIALVIVWVGWNTGVLGGLEVLPSRNPATGEAWSFLDRFWRGTVLLGIGGSLFCLISMYDKFLDRTFDQVSWIHRNLSDVQGKLESRADFFSLKISYLFAALRFLIVIFLVFFAFVVVLFFASLFVFIFLTALAAPLNSAVAVPVAGVVAQAFTIAIAVGVMGALVHTLAYAAFLTLALVVALLFDLSNGNPTSEDILNTSTYLLFLLVLPLLNALTDWVSLGATRHFLRKIRDGAHSGPRAALDIFFDFGVALICLFALAFGIVGILELWTALGLPLAFDWRAFWADVQLGEGGARPMLVLMVVTTLLPSFIHALLGLAHVWAAQTRAYGAAVVLLTEGSGRGSPEGWCRRVRWQLRMGRLIGFFQAALVVIGLSLLCWWSFWGLVRLLS